MKKTLKFKRFLEMNERKRIGEKIREERKKKGLTQEMLAEKTGMQRINISRIEQCKCSAGFDTLQRIAEALDMKVDFVKKSIEIGQIQHQ